MELHKLQLTNAHKRKLLNGHNIQLKHEHLHGGSVVLLSKDIGRKVRSAIKKGTGVRIRFSSEDVKNHNIEHGEGFKELLRGVKRHIQNSGVIDVVKKHGREIGKKIVHNVASQAKKTLHSAIDKHIPKAYSDDLHGLTNDIVDNQASHLHKAIQGQGIGKTERFFINAGKTVRKIANSKPVRQIAQQVGNQLLDHAVSGLTQAALSGAGVKRKYKKGGALFNAGS